jgi:hypothetical protein
MLLFVVIFLLAGTGLLAAGRKAERDAVRSTKWPVVIGRLDSCEVVEVPSTRIGDPNTWQLRLRYTYVVRGITYHSTRYAFGYGDGRDDAPHRAIADRLKSSPQLTVHYDPAHLSEAVLSTEVQTNLTKLGYAGLLMAGISALIWFATD